MKAKRGLVINADVRNDAHPTPSWQGIRLPILRRMARRHSRIMTNPWLNRLAVGIALRYYDASRMISSIGGRDEPRRDEPRPAALHFML